MTRRGHSSEQRGTKCWCKRWEEKGRFAITHLGAFAQSPGITPHFSDRLLSCWFHWGQTAAGLGERQRVARECHWNR